MFGVYVLHIFVAIGYRTLLPPCDLPALAEFAIVTVVSIVTTFAVSAVLARVSILRSPVGLG